MTGARPASVEFDIRLRLNVRGGLIGHDASDKSERDSGGDGAFTHGRRSKTNGPAPVAQGRELIDWKPSGACRPWTWRLS